MRLSLILLPIFAALGFTAPAGAAPAATPIGKRGLCANEPSSADLQALGPGVTWWYNWHYETPAASPGSSPDFLPMVWNAGPERIAGADRFLSAHPGTRALLVLNEPNLSRQANLDPAAAAAAWPALAALARKHHVPLIGPHMAISAPGNETVNGWDDAQKKTRNLSYMTDYLDVFFRHVDPATVDGIGLHAYGNLGELKWAVKTLYERYKKPVWVTEFAQWSAPNDAARLDYLISAVDFLERSPQVAAYAWFKDRMKDGPGLDLLARKKPGVLTDLGRAYARMPVHDAANFHPAPGRIEAEADTVMQGVSLKRTTDIDGDFDVTGIDDGDWMDYQIDSAAAGECVLTVRFSGKEAGGLAVSRDGAETVRVGWAADAAGPAWRTAQVRVRLGRGRQTLRLTAMGGGFRLNWFALSPVERSVP